MVEECRSGLFPPNIRKFGNAPCILGIDEAGRGPVLGPMVYGACYVQTTFESELSKLGFADSKTLTDEKRSSLFQKIQDNESIGWIVHVLSAEELSGGMMQRQKYNLNAISHDTAAGLIRKVLESGANLVKVFVDTVGDSDRYEEKLSGMFPSIQFCVSKKADSIYPVVSAASICAKVTRDRVLAKYQFSERDLLSWNEQRAPTDRKRSRDDSQSDSSRGESSSLKDFGSGYPADPATKSWLARHGDSVFGYPSLVRFSWSTTTLLLDQNAHPFAWEADEEEDGLQSKLTFTASGAGEARAPGKACRARFLADRGITAVAEF